MNRVSVIFASLILVATPLAGCIDEASLEDLIDDIIGCMDENAKNYEDNATTELVGECIYAQSMQTFFDAIDQQIGIEGLLTQNASAGYSITMTAPMDGSEVGLEEDIMMYMQETVKVNLSSNSAYVSIHTSIPLMVSSTSTMVQVGEVVNVHNVLNGMMVSQMGMGTVDESFQTRDASPNVMEWVLPMLADSMLTEEAEDDDDDGEMSDDLDMMNATMSFTFDSLTNSQTMHFSTTDIESGDYLNLTILIDESQNLMSYTMVQGNETGETHISYAAMWGEAITITVDETLPRTSIPVYWDGLSMSGSDDNGDGDEEMFLCDSGEEIPEDYVNDGYEDCYDGSDEFDDNDEGDSDDDGAPSPEDVLDMYDTNMDDYISFEEFWDAFGDEENSENYDSLHDIFNNSDYDMNELLDINELESFIADIHDSNNDGDDASADEIFVALDTDENEEVTASEWADVINSTEDIGMSEEHFDNLSYVIEMYDYDGSGGLDMYEFTEWWNEIDDDDDDDMFLCDSGEEIPEDYVNDGYEDCYDGSDEFDDDNEPDMFLCDSGEEIPEDYVNDGYEDCYDGSDEFDDNDDNDDNDGQSELVTLTLTVANNQTFEAPISDFEIRLLSCFDDARANCTIIVSASLTNLQGEVGNSDGSVNYSYNDVDMDGMISAGDTLVIGEFPSDFEFDLYDSWSDSYVSESAVNGPNMPGFGGILATISMLGAAFLLPRRDED